MWLKPGTVVMLGKVATILAPKSYLFEGFGIVVSDERGSMGTVHTVRIVRTNHNFGFYESELILAPTAAQLLFGAAL